MLKVYDQNKINTELTNFNNILKRFKKYSWGKKLPTFVKSSIGSQVRQKERSEVEVLVQVYLRYLELVFDFRGTT